MLYLPSRAESFGWTHLTVMKGRTMSKSSFNPGVVETFYRVMELVFAILAGMTTVGHWLNQMFIAGYDRPGAPGAVIFVFIFGWVVMLVLANAERSHRKSVKWYYHGGKAVLVK